ncbi:MAG TPA: beta-ketoacyl synthase N-terminal-like domain-containing protein [Candidatus Thermoplasmatota archaeon]|nr:beta-ketoacyl synthase N-terminal-like domain-containing protein [Candidatus Thermoplasmatota archaeon]
MPRRVALVAAGMSRFGARPETPKQLFDEAWREMLERAGTGWDARIDEAWIGTVGFGGHQPGNSAALFLQGTPSLGAPAHRVENACASSGFAIRDAFLALRSGAIDVALAAGVESMTPFTKAHRGYWLGVSGDTEVERAAGLTFPGVYALMARAHMQEFGTTRAQLAAVAVKNHANGAHNPHAQFQKPTTLDKALAAPMVADPLGLFDCCSTTDGAAALLLVGEERVPEFTDRPIWLTGSGAATDALALHDRVELTGMLATRKAAAAALTMAGRSIHDLDAIEVHDCFTIAEVMATEDLGLFAKGKGGIAAAEGRTAVGGEGIPVNASGGLKAKGHPLGATGAGQAVEVYEQMRGLAAGRQVPGAKRMLTHNVGGSGATCAVHVWESEAE